MASPSARSDVDAARALLAGLALPTPLVHARSLSDSRRDVYLKIETGLPTGSFKVRGAIYALSTHARSRPIAEVVAASTGNHGAAVAHAAQLLHIPATIFLPARPNPIKAARIRGLGARLIEIGAPDLAAAIDAAYDYCRRTGAFFLHDATDANIPIGAATIAAEILEQRPAAAAIYVPMGDTALVRGVAAAAKRVAPSIAIVGVAAERAPAYAVSWRDGSAIETASADTIADGLAVRRALAPNVAAIRSLVDDVRLVSEEQMLEAIDWLEMREGVTAEPSGAATTAALMSEVRQSGADPAAAANESAAQRPAVVLLVTGGNISPDTTALVHARRRRVPGPPP